MAAIYAQLGQKQKALELLKRHFFQYERYESVRSKEMMEARVDEVFAELREDLGLRAVPHYSTLCYAAGRLLKKGPSSCSFWVAPCALRTAA